MSKVDFLIDGLNVYHSALQIKQDTGTLVKWLDLSSLCKSYMFHFGKDAKFNRIHYFSAIQYYLQSRNPLKIKRHEDYIKCLKQTGIHVNLGRFKQKEVNCYKCNNRLIKHEEKETDVAIAVKLLELFFTNACDTVVIMTGDTDLTPAVKTAQTLFPEKKIAFAFPYARKNKELSSLAPDSFSISKTQYLNYQLPNPVVLQNGQRISRPNAW